MNLKEPLFMAGAISKLNQLLSKYRRLVGQGSEADCLSAPLSC